MQLADDGHQALVLDSSVVLPGGPALVVCGRRHAQAPADRLDPEVSAPVIDERAHFVRSWSSSLAKNTEADLRIALALRSS